MDQKRELHETARMDVGAARERCPRASEAAGAFLFKLLVAIFARIHPSPKGSLRLDDSDDFDKPAVARPVR